MRGIARRAYIALRPARQFGLALALGACTVVHAQTDGVEMRPNIAYGPLPAEQADLYLPALPKGRRPAVVVIHGGGWVSGSRHAADYLASVLASKGVVVLNIDYRLADKAVPDTHWPAQLVDAQLAVRFLRAHAAEYGIDPARMGAVGDSAGAHLAVFLGTTTTVTPGDEAGLYPGQRPDVKAVVDQFGPMDVPSIYGIGAIEAMFGTPPPPQAEVTGLSPLPNVTAHSAAVYIIHGYGDRVVPFASSQQLADTLKAHRVAVELVPYQGDHGYTGLSAEQVGKLQADAITWLVARLER